MMLRRREEYSEIQDLKNQIKELKEDLKSIKLEMRTNKISGATIFNKSLEKSANITAPKNGGYNQQLFKQFSKIINNSFNVPNSFGTR